MEQEEIAEGGEERPLVKREKRDGVEKSSLKMSQG